MFEQRCLSDGGIEAKGFWTSHFPSARTGVHTCKCTHTHTRTRQYRVFLLLLFSSLIIGFHSFHKYLLGACHMLGTLLDTGDTAVKKDQNSCLLGAYILAGIFLSSFLLERVSLYN